ncbi:hypothetical protein QFZ22_000714 [Streptomyces canus]|uniref:Uncharacterized protein n=2 Tax=Streptomyces canus TaxID=58343 RepID=A0AAW8F3L5_9ACTN|nr:hypothetical protein [Streptomyces canus]
MCWARHASFVARLGTVAVEMLERHVATTGVRSQQEVLARHRANLEAFVLRARRVEAHSLAAEWDELVALAGAPYTVTVLENGEARFRQDLPAEEVVESAAARIRPLLLETDACSYLKALAGVGFFCRSMPDDQTWVRTARAEWRARTGSAPTRGSGYQVMIGNAVTSQAADLDDQRLAMAWIYGDVVHHDTERLKETDPFGLTERFRAAAPLVAWVMVRAIELLNYVRALQECGALELQPEVFDQEVVLQATLWEHTGRVYSAPVGTPAPVDALTPIGEGWTPLSGNAVLRQAEE